MIVHNGTREEQTTSVTKFEVYKQWLGAFYLNQSQIGEGVKGFILIFDCSYSMERRKRLLVISFQNMNFIVLKNELTLYLKFTPLFN